MKILSMLGVLLMTVFSGYAQLKPKDTIPENIKKADLKKYIDEGNRLYQLGKASDFKKGDSLYTEALVNYVKALKADSNSIEGQFNIADATYKLGNFSTASEMFKHIIANTDDKDIKSKAYHNLGNSLLKEEKFEESLDAYKQALKANPDDMDTKYNYAYAKQKLQKQQQQQQQQQQNQDKKDDKKDEQQQQQQQKQDKKDDQNKDQQQQQQDQQKQDKKDEQQQQKQPQPNQMSKEEAERMLNAVERDEKDIQDKLRKVKGSKVKVEKDW